jgi:hypothetical protein
MVDRVLIFAIQLVGLASVVLVAFWYFKTGLGRRGAAPPPSKPMLFETADEPRDGRESRPRLDVDAL